MLPRNRIEWKQMLNTGKLKERRQVCLKESPELGKLQIRGFDDYECLGRFLPEEH